MELWRCKKLDPIWSWRAARVGPQRELLSAVIGQESSMGREAAARHPSHVIPPPEASKSRIARRQTTKTEPRWLSRQSSQRARRFRGFAPGAPCPSADRAADPMALCRLLLLNTNGARFLATAPGQDRLMLFLPRPPPVWARLPSRSACPPALRKPPSARPAPRPVPSQTESWRPTTSSTLTQTRPFPRSGSARPL